MQSIVRFLSVIDHNMMKMLFSLFIGLTFFICECQSIVSQILPSVSILEESPLATIVVDLRPIFQTLNVHPNQAALLHSQPSQPFEYIAGQIRLKSRLDREDYVRKRFCLGGNLLDCNFTLTLTVNLNQAPYNYILSQPISCHDINDVVPKFSQSEAKISMAENVPLGHRIPLEMAIDADSPPFGIDTYRLETIDGHDQSQFSIIYDNQSRELELIVQEKLDREKIASYKFKLLAIDRGHPPNVAAQSLTIDISDINDSPPRFQSSIYNITVAENTLPEYLLKIRATDADTGPNAELTYRLRDDHDGLFRLEKSTGILTLTQALDYELHRSYRLEVDVVDSEVNSPFSDTCEIHIDVLDQNDHPPSIQMKFHPMFVQNADGTMAYVKESFDIHLPIAFVNVHDQDSGDNGKAELTVEPHRLFYLETIRPNAYAMKSSRPFDRESISFYQIELRARDFGQPSLRRSMTFELNITDINDQKPIFKSNYTFDVIENNRVPLTIGQVTAQDADQDLNGQLSYDLVSPSADFFISPSDGTLSSNTSFDYESQRTYRFQVRARDHGEPALESVVSVQVNVVNVNEYAPEFERETYVFSFYENATKTREQLIGQVKAFDRDYGDQIRYALTNYEDLFRIDQEGQLWTETIFDREVQDEYKLTIIASDNSTMGSTAVIIQIKDINDNSPMFIWPDVEEIRHVLSDDHSARLDPEQPSAQFIADILIRDDDIGNNSLHQLKINHDQWFYIGGNSSLWLRNSSMLPGVYQVELQVTNFPYETRKSLRIIVIERHSLGLSLLKNLRQTFSHLPVFFVILLMCFASLSLIFLLVYYVCFRHNVRKRLYGSRLIVNDEDKSKQNSPTTKTSTMIGPASANQNYASISKQRKNSQATSGTSPSTTDGEFSSSLLSCPLNGNSSSSSDFHPSSTVSALTTLTRKSTRRSSTTKNVSFQPPSTHPSHDHLFQNNSSSYHETSSSTFSTLPKSSRRDTSASLSSASISAQPVLTDLPRTRPNHFPTLQTLLYPSNNDGQTTLPKPPPLLNGINLLDKMLNKSSKDDPAHTVSSSSSTSHSGWYNVTSNYQTRASIV